MKLHLAVFFFFFFVTTCLFCCVFVTSDTVFTLPFPPPPDQVEILLAFKKEFPHDNNCEPNWELDYLSRQEYKANISTWTKDSNFLEGLGYFYEGVGFDEKTGVVTHLLLTKQCLTNLKSNSSLFRFKHLKYLDLTRNNFDSFPFPAGFSRLTNLEFLHLGRNGFIGEVPPSISNLSRLTYLGLSYNKLTGPIPNVQNLTLLTTIDLSYNHFSGTIPSSLFTMPSLTGLFLTQNHLQDPLENLTSSPSSNLVYLDLAYNLLSCRILEPISKLPNLIRLDLSFQNTTYNTINFGFLPFKSLQYLDLSGFSISRLNISSMELKRLTLSSCNITEFPTFIKTLQKLEDLTLSKNRLEGKVPKWLWSLPSLFRVDLSHNSFNIIEDSPQVLLNSTSLNELDLSSNAFQGSLPLMPPNLKVMAASENNFTGGIPLTFCNLTRLNVLDLSNNNFGGSIPQCLSTSEYLGALKLSNNNLIGRLLDIQATGLTLLDVGNNQISGKLPRSLLNCTILKFLNVEGNRITDTFPFWLKPLLSLEVIVLRSNRFYGPISSPESSVSFPALRIIDISRNMFNGSLPMNYFVNWSSPLVSIPQAYRWPQYTGDEHSKYSTAIWYYPSVYLRNKGRSMELELIPDTFTAIDFSGNRFKGKIPESIGLLKSLMVLDLSNNDFTGYIPSSLAKLTQLESLDLSRNQLSGRIPQELRVLTFLSYINVSDNKLNGEIPQSSQIVGQPKSSFEGNIDLCGLPLQETCFKNRGSPSSKTPLHTQDLKQEQEQVLNWKAAAIGYGPGVLFGLVIGQALASYKPALFYKLFRL